MNYDRLLTRVFDKQEKKMLYPGDKFPDNFYPPHTNIRLVGVTNIGLIISVYDENANITYPTGLCICYIEFGDRFVPMMCTAAKTDDAKKLLYESDIIKHNSSLAIIKWDLYEGLYAEPLIYDDACIFHSTAFETCSYVGNKWEQPKLLEVKA